MKMIERQKRVVDVQFLELSSFTKDVFTPAVTIGNRNSSGAPFNYSPSSTYPLYSSKVFSSSGHYAFVPGLDCEKKNLKQLV